MDKLITENFNAITFSLVGMSIVFIGLSIIALYITLFPKLLQLLEVGSNKPDGREILSEAELEEEVLIAVMVAFRLHNLSGADEQQVTWKRHLGPKSSWDISRRADTIRRL